MSLESLKILLNRRRQRFVCTPAGVDTDNKNDFTALITHKVTPPIEASRLKQLEKEIGCHDQLFELLSTYGSIRLYCDTLSEDSAFYVAHPDEWQELQEDFSIWLDDLDDDEEEDLLPDWIDNVIVIGEIPSSGSYYLLPTVGAEKGKVYEFEHDGFEFIKVGEDIFSFVDKICTVTDDLIGNILSHTRYSDGKTDIQWLAQKYVYDE